MKIVVVVLIYEEKLWCRITYNMPTRSYYISPKSNFTEKVEALEYGIMVYSQAYARSKLFLILTVLSKYVKLFEYIYLYTIMYSQKSVHIVYNNRPNYVQSKKGSKCFWSPFRSQNRNLYYLGIYVSRDFCLLKRLFPNCL